MAPLRTSSQTAANAAPQAAQQQPYRYAPRSLSIHSRRRFNTRRKREYLLQVGDRSTSWQLAAIESLLRREWVAIVAERSGDPYQALRADHDYQKLLGDFRRSLPPPAAAPQPPSFEQVLSGIIARHEDDAA
jgi:hypothetical protein